MKSILGILPFISIFFTTVAQNSAHPVKVKFMQADGRGETALTIDDSGTVKIWGLKDGKLITSMKNNSTEWYTKQVRYKFYNYDRLKTDMIRTIEEPYGGNWEYYKIMNSESPIGHVKFAKDALSSEDYNRETQKLLFYGITNGKASIWIFDPKISSTEAKLYDSYKLEGIDYIAPEWSPKGNFIICPYSKMIWNMATGKSVNFAKDVIPQGVKPYCFNAEEDKISIATKNGLTVLDSRTGKTIATYAVPAELKIDQPSTMQACSDGKSFLYMKKDEIFVKDPENPLYRKVWLVTEGKILAELVD